MRHQRGYGRVLAAGVVWACVSAAGVWCVADEATSSEAGVRSAESATWEQAKGDPVKLAAWVSDATRGKKPADYDEPVRTACQYAWATYISNTKWCEAAKPSDLLRLARATCGAWSKDQNKAFAGMLSSRFVKDGQGVG